MLIAKKIRKVRKNVRKAKMEGKRVGFVPTMGFLHEGHLSLVRKAVQENDFVVVSIFVNPTQFGPHEDFDSYPRDYERDVSLLEKIDTDLIFIPEVAEMYSENNSTFVNVNNITDRLCGSSRPAHFQGVTTVVSKLFNIVQPDRAYFGQKDYQQLLVIKKMVKDLNFPVEIIGLPIVREEDGLAMSSRNKYLNEEERRQALILYKSLLKAKELVEKEKIYDIEVIRQQIKEMIDEKPAARIDYVQLVDPETLDDIDKVTDKLLIALAVYVGDTRLIDNMVIHING
ncbi:MAG: pantoate--beta-alanine ligase [Halanaerobiaceae bacterium]